MKLRRRYGRAWPRPTRSGVFTVVDGGYHASHKTKKKAIEEAQYLERRGGLPYVYEFNESKPERHRRIVYGPGLGTIAPALK